MRIGLFGGSFNPPHLGHQIIAESMCELADFEEIWWIPAAIPPHRQWKPVESAEHRLAMTRLAIAANPRFKVSTVELDRRGRSYTVDTLGILKAEYPEHSFHLIVGGDSLVAFSTWKDPESIMEMAPLKVYPRPNVDLSDVPDAILSRVTIYETPLLGISSSAIRDKLKLGQSIRYLVPPTVQTYIREHDLFS